MEKSRSWRSSHSEVDVEEEEVTRVPFHASGYLDGVHGGGGDEV
jgi:hypothetical protein